MDLLRFKYNNGGGVCSRCVLDKTVEGIHFNEKGECTFCGVHDELESKYRLDDDSGINKIVKKIKKYGRGKSYDCVVGLSGGKDSSYTLVQVCELGLRPLVVHFDNGWNSNNAVSNIEKLCKRLNVDLFTHVADWEEFKGLQKAFLLASTPDGEVPTDYVISSVLYQVASKEGIKYIIGGQSFRTEGTTPLTWTYQDPIYIKDVYSKYSKKRIKSFPIMGPAKFLYYSLVRRVKWIRLLYYMQYDEDSSVTYLEKNYDWKNYGGKHFESNYTSFYQSYILTRKHNIDKRKLHYSAKIRSGQMTRDVALELLTVDPYEGGEKMMNHVVKKLDLTKESFDKIMEVPTRSFRDYKSLYKLILLFKPLIVVLNNMGIVPSTVIKKYYSFKY